MPYKSKYYKKPVAIIVLFVITKKKYLKCECKTFILPHMREYGLLPVIACSRNCWENTQTKILQKSKYHKGRVAIFILFVLTQKIFKIRA